MYKALYRKYRPMEFSDVVGQEHITKTLSNQVSMGNVSHAYLFTGSRGTGKTTCAKILAKAVNCLNPDNGNPCGECANCKAIGDESLPDVMEIDAASNNGVDDIRELRDRIAFAPAQAKYKVYIIDEVHMLSNAASNALLKTLEEPPSHAIFILATTEVNALLPTILSRCQRYDFKRIEPEDIVGRIKYVAEKENLNITDGAAAIIATVCDGGMRDALSILDLTAAAGRDIDEELVNSICGRAGTEYLFKLAETIVLEDTAGALKIIAELHNDSVDMKRLALEICEFYRTITLICSGVDPKTACGSTEAIANKYLEFSKKTSAESSIHSLRIINESISDMASGNRRSALEAAIITLTNPRLDVSNEALLSRIAALENKIKSGNFAPQPSAVRSEVAEPIADDKAEKQEMSFERKTETKPASPPPAPPIPIADKIPEGDQTMLLEWNDIVELTFKKAPLMYGLIKGTKASKVGNVIIIHSNSDQLRGQLSKKEGINYKGLCNAILEIMGSAYAPVMEPKAKVDISDPLMSFAEKLDNL